MASDLFSGETAAPRFYGRRKGKPLRVMARSLIETRLADVTVARPSDGACLELSTLFGHAPSALWLEVGFGGGEHLAWQAAQHPDVSLIGGEVFLNGIASLLGHLDRNGATNVRVYPDDIRHLFPCLPDGCLDRVFVLFPDPWPKKRHADRRFIGPDNLAILSRLMRSGAELRVASDDPTYQNWAEAQLFAHPDFVPVDGLDPLVKPVDWPESRYERKALDAGRLPRYYRFLRR